MPLHPSGFIEPCLRTVSRTVPTGRQWAYEIKHDGFRFLAVRQGIRVRVFSRGGHDWSKQLRAIVEALLALPARSVVLVFSWSWKPSGTHSLRAGASRSLRLGQARGHEVPS